MVIYILYVHSALACAYVPDLPGCVAVGDTIDKTEHMIREAIAFHIEGMREDGLAIPEPTCVAREVDVAVPGERC